MSDILRVGDEVLYSGNRGKNMPKKQVVVSMEVDGEMIEEVEWSLVRDCDIMVDLDSNHWGYGFQITKTGEE
jgi:hypothetical protein